MVPYHPIMIYFIFIISALSHQNNQYFIILHFKKWILCNAASYWFPSVAPLVLMQHDNFKRTIRKKKTQKNFINIFVLFKLPPFKYNLMEDAKVWTISYIYIYIYIYTHDGVFNSI